MKKLIMIIVALTLVCTMCSSCMLLLAGSDTPDTDEGAADETPDTSDEPNNDPVKDAEKEPEEEEKIAYEIKENKITVAVNSIGSVWVQCLTIVENTGNTNLYLNNAKYDIETESGELVDTVSGVNAYPQVIAPGETAIYYEETKFDGEIDKTYVSKPKLDIVKAKVPQIILPTSDVKTSTDEYGFTKIVGRFENVTEKEQSMCYVSIAYYDANGALLAHDFTIATDTVQPGEKASFESTYTTKYFGFDPGSVANVIVTVFPHQFQF